VSSGHFCTYLLSAEMVQHPDMTQTHRRSVYSIYGNCHIWLDLCELLDAVQFLLHLIKIYVMKTLAYVGRDITRSCALPNRITPKEIDPWTGGWVGLGVFGLYGEEKDICFC
jgi:hypothetical protein